MDTSCIQFVYSFILPLVAQSVYSLNDTNPFILNANVASYWNKPEAKKGNGLNEHGQVVHVGLVKEQRQVVHRDVTPFVKFFKGSFITIKGLGTASLGILDYITENIKAGHDSVHLPVKDVIEKCGYKTRRTYYVGIKELTENNLLAAKDKKHNFWINPNIFFKGDRRKIKS